MDGPQIGIRLASSTQTTLRRFGDSWIPRLNRETRKRSLARYYAFFLCEPIGCCSGHQSGEPVIAEAVNSLRAFFMLNERVLGAIGVALLHQTFLLYLFII